MFPTSGMSFHTRSAAPAKKNATPQAQKKMPALAAGGDTVTFSGKKPKESNTKSKMLRALGVALLLPTVLGAPVSTKGSDLVKKADNDNGNNGWHNGGGTGAPGNGNGQGAEHGKGLNSRHAIADNDNGNNGWHNGGGTGAPGKGKGQGAEHGKGLNN
jgi:hypothetical protein